MAITDTRPELYRALLADGWTFHPYRVGGEFRRKGDDRARLRVEVKQRRAVELHADLDKLARFEPSLPDEAIVAAVTTYARAEPQGPTS